jgi:hypothetical protein
MTIFMLPIVPCQAHRGRGERREREMREKREGGIRTLMLLIPR